MPPAERAVQRLARLRLAPLRSLRALADPRVAAQRTVRLISAVLGRTPVRCTLPASGYRVERGQVDGAIAEGLSAHVVAVQWQQQTFGSLEMHSKPERWQESETTVAELAGSLALLLALHGTESPRALRGTILTPQRLHDLNNVANTITLQIGVMHAMLLRGRSAEAAQFAERCVAQSGRLVALLVALRHA